MCKRKEERGKRKEERGKRKEERDALNKDLGYFFARFLKVLEMQMLKHFQERRACVRLISCMYVKEECLTSVGMD